MNSFVIFYSATYSAFDKSVLHYVFGAKEILTYPSTYERSSNSANSHFDISWNVAPNYTDVTLSLKV